MSSKWSSFVVPEGDELGCATKVLTELRITTALSKICLQAQRLSRDREISGVEAPGDRLIEGDLGNRPTGGRAHLGARRGAERIAQLGHEASSPTGSLSSASRRSIATSWTTRAWYRGPSGSLDSGSSSGSGASPFA